MKLRFKNQASSRRFWSRGLFPDGKRAQEVRSLQRGEGGFFFGGTEDKYLREMFRETHAGERQLKFIRI